LCRYTDPDQGDELQACVEAGICRRLAALLRHDSAAVVTPALRVLGNIIAGDEIQTQAIINAGALHSLHYVLHSGKRALKKEACWAVSNALAGTQQQVQAVIDAGLVQQLVDIIKNGHQETKRQACWALTNAMSYGTSDQLVFLIKAGAIPALSAMVPNDDGRVAWTALDGLENILNAQESLIADGKMSKDGIKELWRAADILRILQDTYDQTDDEDVHMKCRGLILDRFFDEYLHKFEDDLAEKGLLPPDEEDSVFRLYAGQLRKSNHSEVAPHRRLLKKALLSLPDDYTASTCSSGEERQACIDSRLTPLRDDAWSRRRHLACFRDAAKKQAAATIAKRGKPEEEAGEDEDEDEDEGSEDGVEEGIITKS
jgi:Armadillo/beta-catenin-like repeat